MIVRKVLALLSILDRQTPHTPLGCCGCKYTLSAHVTLTWGVIANLPWRRAMARTAAYAAGGAGRALGGSRPVILVPGGGGGGAI